MVSFFIKVERRKKNYPVPINQAQPKKSVMLQFIHRTANLLDTSSVPATGLRAGDTEMRRQRLFPRGTLSKGFCRFQCLCS